MCDKSYFSFGGGGEFRQFVFTLPCPDCRDEQVVYDSDDYRNMVETPDSAVKLQWLHHALDRRQNRELVSEDKIDGSVHNVSLKIESSTLIKVCCESWETCQCEDCDEIVDRSHRRFKDYIEIPR